MKPKEVLAFAKENGAKMLDMRFMDFPGIWQHFSVPIGQLDEGSFEDGYGFDGSSIRGWQPINASDMLVIPDPATAKMDPFSAEPTLSDDLRHRRPGHPRALHPRPAQHRQEGRGLPQEHRDRRHGLHRARRRSSSSSTTSATSPASNGSFYEIDSVEGTWNTGRDEGPNLGYKPRPKEGYFPVPPTDKFQDLRTEMVMVLEQLGIEIEAQHHEVATAAG